jgi:hypothetical protein
MYHPENQKQAIRLYPNKDQPLSPQIVPKGFLAMMEKILP